MSAAVPVVLGLDIGGTRSRALVADLTGRCLGVGEAGGGNPNSHPPAEAVEQVATAARAALSGFDPAGVHTAVLGMAGISKLADPSVADLLGRAWTSIGLTCPVRKVGDAEVAFAAGTASPSGTVLIAGTGAVGARIDRHQVTATADGYGWLLGDEGSAFWLGREAVRAALRALDRHGRPGDGLAAAVLSELLTPVDQDTPARVLRARMIAAVNSAPPVLLSRLAPLVTTAARNGDEAGLDIVHRAALLLTDTAQATRSPEEATPVVLAGSLVPADNPVGAALRYELGARGIGPVRTAGPGAAGAAWLAVVDLLGDRDLLGEDQDADDELHARLLTAAGTSTSS